MAKSIAEHVMASIEREIQGLEGEERKEAARAFYVSMSDEEREILHEAFAEAAQSWGALRDRLMEELALVLPHVFAFCNKFAELQSKGESE